MLLITIKLVFKKGFWDGLQYFDFFEAFPRDCRQRVSIEQWPARRATREFAEHVPSQGSFSSKGRNSEGIPSRFGNFCHIFSLLMLLLQRNNIPGLNDESHH